jgi:hypothetical protein
MPMRGGCVQAPTFGDIGRCPMWLGGTARWPIIIPGGMWRWPMVTGAIELAIGRCITIPCCPGCCPIIP